MLPVALLLAVAGAQVTLATNRRPEPVEGRRLRDVLDHRRCRPPARAGVRERARAIGGDRDRAVARGRGACAPRCCPATPQLTRLARRVVERERRYQPPGRDASASRPGASSTRPTRWRRPPASCASSSTVWTRLLRPARDEDGVPDAVLDADRHHPAAAAARRLVGGAVRAGGGVPVAGRAGRQASAGHLAAGGGAGGGQDRRRLAALRQPHLPARLLVPGDRAGALGSRRPRRRWRRAADGSSAPRSRWRCCGRRCCRRTTSMAASSG